MAKGMASGFPIAAVVGKAEIMDAPLPGGLGGTYAGSPIGCAAALAVIDVIKNENLVDAANRIGAVFKARLDGLRKKYPSIIGDIRAERGAMVAVELVKEGDSSKPNSKLVQDIVGLAYQRRLIILPCGIRGNVFRFLPALTITDELIHEGMDIFEPCVADALS
jgi:4-aminobutyrate aminotransferase/(S)-3-amino-2-methylpropionate transaminase